MASSSTGATSPAPSSSMSSVRRCWARLCPATSQPPAPRCPATRKVLVPSRTVAGCPGAGTCPGDSAGAPAVSRTVRWPGVTCQR